MRVKDIVNGTTGSAPANLKVAGDFLYFTANDGVSGVELWRTDGTDVGTMRVSDIRSGTASSFSNTIAPPFFTEANGLLYFQADDGVHGPELWRSDGTEAGTFMIRDIWPGSTSSLSATNINQNPYFTSFDGALYFAADDGTNGIELWKSDGTLAGTSLAADIFPGLAPFVQPTPNSSTPSSLTVANGALYFVATDSAHGRELWKLELGATVPTLVKDINPNGSSAPIAHAVHCEYAVLCRDEWS